MAETKLTTVQTDPETRDKLKEIAKANKRSMAAQFSWMVACEYEKLQSAKAQEPKEQKTAKRAGRAS